MVERYHIIVDGKKCDKKLLDDKKLIEKTIKDITKMCKMTIMHGPIVLQGDPKNPGVTGFAIIDFSHISIHTFTATDQICVDVFSCKKYDYTKVKAYVMKTFKLEKKNAKIVKVKYD